MTARRASGALLAAAAVWCAGCGRDDASGGAEDAFSRVEAQPRKRLSDDRAAPRWEPITIMRGSGNRSRVFEVADDAIQWRARWRCREGRLALGLDPPPEPGNLLARGRCPGTGEVESIENGKLRLSVRTAGAWRVSLAQQVTTPLQEPPLPEMRGAAVVAKGDFYGIERRGRGTARLHRLPGGRLVLRFEGFRTSPNSDLFVWLSQAARPLTTRQALRAPHRQFALLKSTLGDQNYLLPPGIRADSVRSIVIWCEPVRIAYAAAALR
jgi:hypothetical protein